MNDLPDCLFCDQQMHAHMYVEYGRIGEGDSGEIPVCKNHHRNIRVKLHD